jgi:hypothetical protein
MEHQKLWIRLRRINDLVHRIEHLLLGPGFDIHGAIASELTSLVVGGWGKKLIQDLRALIPDC